MSPDDGSEWRFAFGDDQIGGHAAAFGAGVRNVMDRNVAAWLDSCFLNVEWRFLIVVEVAEQIGSLRS
jgi:hypothetical protein